MTDPKPLTLSPLPLTHAEANAVYDVLASECGASEHNRESFVASQTRGVIIEWRFMGNLGFGGKLWRNNGRMYVNCYREDENARTKAAIARANNKLALLEVANA